MLFEKSSGLQLSIENSVLSVGPVWDVGCDPKSIQV